GGTLVLAKLSPASPAVLATSQTFTWNNANGATGYHLLLGTNGVGTSNLYNSGAIATGSVKVTLPAHGVKVWARFYQLINDAWQYTDSTYTEGGTLVLAKLSPASPAVLAASQTFTWNDANGATGYQLLLGTTGLGSSNLYSSSTITTGSVKVTLPAHGVKVWARFYQLINDAWQYADSTYTEGGTLTLAKLSPASPAVLATSQTFTWNNANGATGYRLLLGTNGLGSSNLYSSDTLTAGSVKVTLPTQGVKVWARFYQFINDAWEYADSTYTEPGTLVLAKLSPASPAVLAASQTFTWNNANGATGYKFMLGNTGAGSSNLYSSGIITAGSATVSVPADGKEVWARFYQLINDAWQYADSTYTESNAGAVSALSCSSGSVTGAATLSCQVTLVGKAGTSGQSVSVSSNDARVVVPSSVTVTSGATSATFTASVQAVAIAQKATLSATSEGATKTFAINLGAAVATLSLQSTSVPFGDVTDGSPSYQSVTLTDSGLYVLAISAGTLTGSGYTMPAAKFPLNINPGQTASLEIEFDPTTPGVSNGSITLTSNSSKGTTSSISLSGTGVSTASYEVNLTWDAPTGSSDPVAGYNVYRAISGSSTYALLNSSLDTTTAYTDATAQGGTSYIYYVESVDDAGNSSSPSNTFTVSIP
ncbi:MAG: choice-of-anchor D domain-containing protein, partial [Terracidiphilus sp.]